MDQKTKKIPGVNVRAFPVNQVSIQCKTSMCIADTVRLLKTDPKFKEEFLDLFFQELDKALQELEKSRPHE